MEFVKTTTQDGVILQGLLVQQEKTDTIILHIHGMSGNFWENSFIKEMFNKYPQQGIAFVAVETRGSELLRWFQTTKEEPRLLGNAYEVFEDSLHDINAWIAFLEEQGYTTIHLQGHSLGCAKITYHQKTISHPKVRSLSLISPADMMGLLVEPENLKAYNDFKAKAEELVAKGQENELLPGLHWGFAKLSAKTFLNFSFENNNLAIFNYFNPKRGFDTIQAITIPILSILGTQDDGIVTDAHEATKLLEKHAKHFHGEVFEGAKHSFDGFEERITSTVLAFIKNLS